MSFFKRLFSSPQKAEAQPDPQPAELSQAPAANINPSSGIRRARASRIAAHTTITVSAPGASSPADTPSRIRERRLQARQPNPDGRNLWPRPAEWFNGDATPLTDPVKSK